MILCLVSRETWMQTGRIEDDVNEDKQQHYEKSSREDWTMHVDREHEQGIPPIPFGGMHDHFHPNLTWDKLM